MLPFNSIVTEIMQKALIIASPMKTPSRHLKKFIRKVEATYTIKSVGAGGRKLHKTIIGNSRSKSLSLIKWVYLLCFVSK